MWFIIIYFIISKWEKTEDKVKKGGEVKVVYTHGKKKNAIANAIVQQGKGIITINRIPLNSVEPKPLRIRLFEPVLLVGAKHCKDLKIRIKITGGGSYSSTLRCNIGNCKGIGCLETKICWWRRKDTYKKNIFIIW